LCILPKLFNVHIGFIIAIALAIIIYIFFNYTKRGYEIDVVGESINTAKYAGMNVNKIIISTMIISGGICGITGMIQASAVSNTLSNTITGGVGFTAIITTWLANLNPLLIIIISFLFAALTQGASFIQTAFNIPQSVALILEGLILLFILGSEFFIQYKILLGRKK